MKPVTVGSGRGQSCRHAEQTTAPAEEKGLGIVNLNHRRPVEYCLIESPWPRIVLEAGVPGRRAGVSLLRFSESVV